MPSGPTLTFSQQYRTYHTQQLTSWTTSGIMAHPSLYTWPCWSCLCQDAAMAWGSHQSAHLHLPFLEQEMLTMVCKGQWMVLPYKAVVDLPNLCLSPLGLIPKCKR